MYCGNDEWEIYINNEKTLIKSEEILDFLDGIFCRSATFSPQNDLRHQIKQIYNLHRDKYIRKLYRG